MAKKFLSITPTSDWWAGYEADRKQYFHRIVALVLCEDDEGTTLEAMDVIDVNAGGYEVCGDHGNFRGLLHLADFEAPGSKLHPWANERFAAGRY